MKAVILAAGESSRFYPYNTNHKATFNLLGKSIIEHTLLSIKKAGINEVLIIVAKNNSIRESINKEFLSSLSIAFVTQLSPLGMGNALLQAKNHLNEDFFVLHAHHVDFHLFAQSMLKRKVDGNDSVLLTQEENNVNRFGVVEVKKDFVVDIVEKPFDRKETSRLRLIGIYLLNQSFLGILKKIPSAHYSFEDALKLLVKKSPVRFVKAQAKTVSLKFPWELLEMNKFLLASQKRAISKKSDLALNAKILGDVVIEDGVKIMENATIKGPCYIGKNSYIGTNAIVRDNVSLEENVVIGSNMEIKNSIVLSNSTTHSGFIGDSVIGKSCKIAAYFCTANVRIDRKSIKVSTVNGSVDSELKSLGVVMGDNVRVGIRVSTMPGVIVGNNVTIGPSTTVMQNIDDHIRFYTKFKEVIEENQAKEKKNKLVLFDIDYTLFDVSYFDKHFHHKLASIFNSSEDEVKKKSIEIIVELVKEDKFLDIDKYVDKLVDAFKIQDKKKEVQDLLFAGDFFKSGFYPDAESTVRDIEQIARIGIFSQGDEKLQGAKIKQSGFSKLFEENLTYIIKPRKLDFLPQLLEKHKNDKIFLVEDKPGVINKVKETAPHIFTIWIKRGKFVKEAENIPNFSPDATVTSLDQVIEIVKGN